MRVDVCFCVCELSNILRVIVKEIDPGTGVCACGCLCMCTCVQVCVRNLVSLKTWVQAELCVYVRVVWWEIRDVVQAEVLCAYVFKCV